MDSNMSYNGNGVSSSSDLPSNNLQQHSNNQSYLHSTIPEESSIDNTIPHSTSHNQQQLSQDNTSMLLEQESQLHRKKRQRRSYSCGPCKLLKIKCDLEIPCASCKKFKRVSRCLLQPPQPPSEEELNKIKERKKRSLNKKLKVSNDIVHTFNDNQNSLASLVTSLSSTSKNLQLANGQSNDNNDQYISSHVRQNHTFNLQPEAIRGISNHPINHITGMEEQSSSNNKISSPGNGFKSTTMNGVNLIERLLNQDTERLFELNMVDIKRIKRLLPNNFNVFEKFFSSYLNSLNPILIDLQDHDEMLKQARLIYFKLLNINDEDSVKNLSQIFRFSIIELRHLSLMFLIMSNGLLFDENNTSQFLLDYNRMIIKDELINDWIKISRFLKLKILFYENLTDLIYLIDFYLIIKNLFLYKNDIIDNYLEFNNLLNYIVLNNDFISLIDDPIFETVDSDYNGNGADGQQMVDQYPDSVEFKILAKYWIQIRLVELEFTFFQFKGSLLVSNQLKNTVVPHRQLLNVLYGQNAKYIDCQLSKHSIEIWGLYYKKSAHSTSIRGIIKNYLELYSNVSLLLSKELKQVAINYKSPPSTSPTKQDIELLIKNQNVLLLSIRWLTFIRIESNYFPSLRYASYFTAMINLFNHFNLIDQDNNNSEFGVIDIIIDQFPIHCLKSYHQCLMYQALFLVLMKYFLINSKLKNKVVENIENEIYRINLYKIYPIIVKNFQLTLNKFMTNKKFQNLSIVPLFKLTERILLEFNQVLKNQPTSIQKSLNKGATPDDVLNNFEDLTDFLYKLKEIIPQENWEFLINLYFGSRDNFFRYVEKVWDLFQYLNYPLDSKSVDGEIYITAKIKFNDQFIKQHIDKLSGFEFNNDVVTDYIKLNVEPNIDD
ncbi:hypothetical protein KGF54_002866 [Candida jiufengensis]|uniref:uncharacterized protein n=1 Tax=Candida jiufengensis TaxID=497108 RepID=UPI002225170D|nr:uncharacterized protein KGF54_002866 [Candida jiufengensis]KAI5953494.1 hypothetical protein KGF54_002866 [Candida jiufengensis]